jgi:lipoprotein-anchoring transpeptidase ErfK/SrfK
MGVFDLMGWMFRSTIFLALILPICASPRAFGADSTASPPQQNAPITASDAEKAGTLPPYPPFDPTVVKYVDPGMAAAEAGLSPGGSPSAKATPAAAAKTDTKKEPPLTPGEIVYRATFDTSYIDPLSWSVTIFKKKHELVIYYKGRLFRTYRAVFGRSFEPGTKLWEGDRRTPEGVYTIVEKHPSRRWMWFLTLNYPNIIDKRRYEELRDGGVIPVEDGRPVGVGGRIGIHGTDNSLLNTGNVNWTTGCVSVDNKDIDQLYKLLPVGTVVIIKP